MSTDTQITKTRKPPAWLVCIDCETTGLDPDLHGLLSIGAFHPASGAGFYVECRPREGCVVDLDAMRVNGQDIAEARARKDSEADAVELLVRWLGAIGNGHRFVLVGKNPRFDREWIDSRVINIPLMLPVMRRLLDVHAVALALAAALGLDATAMKINDIYEALGLPVEPSPHNAFQGAKYAWLALAKTGEFINE